MDISTIVATITPPAEQVPTDFMSFLNNTRQSDYTRLCDFAVDTLSFSTKVNIFHWTCEKGFLHTQFEEVYELLRKFADDLVERVLAQDVRFKITNRQVNITDMIYNTQYAIRKLCEYREEADKLGAFFKDNRGINALFDEMICELDKHIGLIKNFN